MSASNESRYERGSGPRDRSLRVGDKERDAVSEILRQRHLEGHLDADEFQTRLERCMTAKTYADLDALIADLPRPEAEQRREHSWAWRSPYAALVFLPLALIGAIAVGAHVAWLVVPLFFFLVLRPLAWRRWDGGYARRGHWACGPRRTTRM